MPDGYTWLTVSVLAARIGRARSTIRLWAEQQRAWVPERLNEAGHQTYPLERLQEIAVMASRRLRPREISAELARRHGDGLSESSPPEARDDRLVELLERIAADVRRIADRLERDD